MKETTVEFVQELAEVKRASIRNRLVYAKRGKFLAYLLWDESPRIRKEVALQGYGLEVLLNDENAEVRKAALDTMKKGA